jgi:hypothetical protein
MRILLANLILAVAPQELFPSIVTDVPGRAPSRDFLAEVNSNGSWVPVYVFTSVSLVAEKSPTNGYFSHLDNWTVSWVSSQLPVGGGGALLLRVRRAGGAPIRSAAAHPASASACVANVSGGAVYLAATASARIAVDIDGAMDGTDTGPSYAGPPVHAFAWFVDGAPSAGLPDPAAPGTIVVRPGDALPNASALDPMRWPTVIFAPGVHRVASPPNGWTVLTLAANTRYFLCAGAVVHAALAGPGSAANVRLDGFGVLSGEEMARAGDFNVSPQGVRTGLAANATFEGFSLVDFPNHHLILGSAGGSVNTLANVKVLGWRANGDGLHVFGNWDVTDLFMRTQDDSMYLSCGENCSTVFSRVTTWNDANGCAFIFSAGGGDRERAALLDSDVIYARASWAWWSGGRAFCHRGAATGVSMSGVRVDSVRVEDALPSLNAMQFDLTGDGAPVHNASFENVEFRNVRVANWSQVRRTLAGAPLPFGIPNKLFAAGPGVVFRNVAFINVTIAGERMGAGVGNALKWNVSGPGSLENVTVDGVPL